MTTEAPLRQTVNPGTPGQILTPDEIKSLELEILDIFDTFCKDNDLRYWLAYGTLLGAVRHKGFIPWDDDIDLLMPAADYFRFIDLINAGVSIPEPYRIAGPRIAGEALCQVPFCKLYDTRTHTIEHELRSGLGVDEGVWIDVFPLLGLPDDPATVARTQQQAYWLYVKARLASYKRNKGGSLAGSVARTLLKPVTNLLGVRYYLNKLDELSRAMPDFASTALVFQHAEPSKIFQRSWFDETVELEFEGKLYPAPKGYDGFLTAEYGDYMQYPPLEERVPWHDFEASWR